MKTDHQKQAEEDAGIDKSRRGLGCQNPFALRIIGEERSCFVQIPGHF